MGDLNTLNEAGVAGLMQSALDARIAPAPDAQLGPEQARQEIGRLRADPAWAKGYLAGNGDAKARMGQLQGWANPDLDAPAAPATPAATLTREQQIAALNAPLVGHDGEATMAAAMSPPATPEGYQLPPVVGPVTPELTEFRTQARTVLFDSGLPASIGKEMASRIDKGLTSPPSDAQKEQQKIASTSQLKRQWGDNFAPNLAACQAEINRLVAKTPALANWLNYSGAVHDAYLIQQLHNTLQARRAAP